MVKKTSILFVILILIGLTIIVMAASGDEIKIISPSPGSNYTSISGILFNVSYINGTGISNPVNASFFINQSGNWVKIGNTSNTGCNSNSCSGTITNTTIPDGVYSINATLYNSTASRSIQIIENLSSTIYIDNTRPIVFSENITNPLTGGNYSQKIFLNVSAIDATIGIQAILFNITNSSGQQNSTTIATREGSTSNYVIEINTSHYPDGFYNLTIYANDSLGNLNNSARVFNLTFDNTLPSLSHSCDDYSVEEDDTITCTCSSSDSLSGINLSYGSLGSGVSYTANPSTSSTGNNKQTTCTTQDKAGNFNTSTLYYNVTSIVSGGSSGGTSSGGSSGGTTGSSASNNTSNSSLKDSNSSSGGPNSLQGNQENLNNKNKIKINYWILGGIILGAGIVVGVLAFVRKKLDKKRR